MDARVVAAERYTAGWTDRRCVWGSSPGWRDPAAPAWSPPTRADRIAAAWRHFDRQWELTDDERRLLFTGPLPRYFQ